MFPMTMPDVPVPSRHAGLHRAGPRSSNLNSLLNVLDVKAASRCVQPALRTIEPLSQVEGSPNASMGSCASAHVLKSPLTLQPVEVARRADNVLRAT